MSLPLNVSSVLDRCYNTNVDLGKWLVYRTDLIPETCVREVCDLAMRVYNEKQLRQPESELDELSFIKPAEPNVEYNTVGEILDAHIHDLKKILDDGLTPSEDCKIYPFGAIVITKNDWCEKGVSVVHFDKDRGKWKLGQCRIPVKELGIPLTSVSDMDESFDRVRELYIDEGGTPGGPLPVGEWQYSLFGVAIPGGLASELVYDPRMGSYPLEEATFDLISSEGMDLVEIREKFVLDYAKFAREASEWPVKRHPSLFVVIDKPNPETSGVCIGKMVWDRDVDKSDDELREVARNSRVDTRRCYPGSAWITLRDMGDG